MADGKGAGSEAGRACCWPGLVHLEDAEHWTQEWEEGGHSHVCPLAPHGIRGLPSAQGARGCHWRVLVRVVPKAELHCKGQTVEKQARPGKSAVVQGSRQGQWGLDGGGGCESSEWGR